MKKKPLWQRILGKLGFKKYRYNTYYCWDFASGFDCAAEIQCHYDKNGVLNITDFRMIQEPTLQQKESDNAE